MLQGSAVASWMGKWFLNAMCREILLEKGNCVEMQNACSSISKINATEEED